MSSIVVAGDTSGSVTLQAPAVAGSTVLTLPVATDTLVGKATTDVLTNKTLGSGLVAGASLLTSGTAVASTSGTSIDFTGIPSWVKRITVMFNGVTLSASGILVQIGSGSVTTSGYASYSVLSNSGGTANASSTAGFVSYSYFAGATSGSFQLALLSANTWVCNGTLGALTSSSILTTGGNSPALSGALDRVRITTISGSATFTAGSINILYE